MQFDDTVRSRRAMLGSIAALGAFAVTRSTLSSTDRPAPRAVPTPVRQRIFAEPKAASVSAPRGVQPELFDRAIAALDAHGDTIRRRDRIAIADFDAPSSEHRFQFIDLEGGKVTRLLVSHGSGSDPSHSGKLQRFSNQPNSNATCEGAFVTADYYVGKHGRSQRVIGLDPTNDNARDRAIVIHGAWYANPDMLKTHGMLGRSQGCFAVGEQDLPQVFAMLGEGRMIYAGKA
ncbi:murein L,D-transpeptidase catalytic domain family protein [Sphingomonas sp. MJ1 (PH-R8)]|uniref:murein L,D-transpeptidase catalytic domain family protein n=1 Tax=Sphingomonas sp. MJ1 (PH-R8) TaxID=3112950 RepID=UPI003A847EB1